MRRRGTPELGAVRREGGVEVAMREDLVLGILARVAPCGDFEALGRGRRRRRRWDPLLRDPRQVSDLAARRIVKALYAAALYAVEGHQGGRFLPAATGGQPGHVSLVGQFGVD